MNYPTSEHKFISTAELRELTAENERLRAVVSAAKQMLGDFDQYGRQGAIVNQSVLNLRRAIKALEGDE